MDKKNLFALSVLLFFACVQAVAPRRTGGSALPFSSPDIESSFISPAEVFLSRLGKLNTQALRELYLNMLKPATDILKESCFSEEVKRLLNQNDILINNKFDDQFVAFLPHMLHPNYECSLFKALQGFVGVSDTDRDLLFYFMQDAINSGISRSSGPAEIGLWKKSSFKKNNVYVKEISEVKVDLFLGKVAAFFQQTDVRVDKFFLIGMDFLEEPSETLLE